MKQDNKESLPYSRPAWIDELCGDFKRKRSDGEVSLLLRQISAVWGKLGHQPSSSAVTDTYGRIVELNVDQKICSRDWGAHSAWVAMTNAQSFLGQGVRDLGKHCLHIVSGENIEAIGQIWLFAPNRVVVSRNAELDNQQRYIPVSVSYREKARAQRSIEMIEHSSDLAESLDRIKIEKLVQKAGLTNEDSPKSYLSPPEWLNEMAISDAKSYQPREIFRLLHSTALKSVEKGGGPFAAAVVSANGHLISVNTNQVLHLCNCGAHAERTTMTSAMRKLGLDNLRGYQLYSTSAPCIGCAEQITHIAPDKVLWDLPWRKVEELGGFSEGPLKSTYWDEVQVLYNIESEASVFYPEDREMAEAPLRLFAEKVSRDPSFNYLQNKEF